MAKSKLSAGRHRRFNWQAYGRRLRLARLTLGISEAGAAAAHRVTLRTYRRWEAGARQSGRPEPMVSFAERYGVSIDWLVFGNTHGLTSQLAVNPGGKVAILRLVTAA